MPREFGTTPVQVVAQVVLDRQVNVRAVERIWPIIPPIIIDQRNFLISSMVISAIDGLLRTAIKISLSYLSIGLADLQSLDFGGIGGIDCLCAAQDFSKIDAGSLVSITSFFYS